MPKFMFEPRAKRRPMTFETASELAGEFGTSLTATSIRLIDYGSYPAMLVCSDEEGIRWFSRGPGVPTILRPESVGRMTFAHDLITRTVSARTTGEVYSDQWFSSAERHTIHEDSRLIGAEVVLTLLWWKDEGPLIDVEEAQERIAYGRSDAREDD